MSELAARTAGLVSTMDLARLGEVVGALRKEATDRRSARRVIERRLRGPQATEMLELFEAGEFEIVVAALEAACRSVELVRDHLGRTGLVWTGPGSRTLSVRPTRSVVVDLISRSRSSLTLVTYAGHDIADLVQDLDRARLERDVDVRIVLETRLDTLDAKGPDPTMALKHLPLAVPIYRWPKELRGAKGGSMHVKCVVRDRVDALVTSANLTSAALDRNMELGLLVEGGMVAPTIEQHFDDLIDARVLIRAGR
jgi:cardiolipin synthase A/B